MKALKDANLRGAVSMHLDRILSKPELYGILEEVMAAKDAKELVASEAKWIGALAAQRDFLEAVRKSSASLTGHVRDKQRDHVKDSLLKKRSLEKEEEQRLLKLAKTSAKAVKAADQEIANIYRLNWSELADEDRFKDLLLKVEVVNGEAKQGDISVPCLRKGFAAVETWKETLRVQVRMGTFGGQYKKSASVATELRIQEAMYTGDGKEDTDMLFTALCKLLPEAGLASCDLEHPGQAALRATWCYGDDPAMKVSSCTPNGFGMFKTLVSGGVEWLMFDLRKMIIAAKSITASDNISLSKLKELVQNLTAEGLKGFCEKGAICYYVKQEAGTSLWVPQVASSVRN